MFADAFLPNLAIFVVAQVVAWIYLRTGLVRTGIATIVATWLAADLALVARFALDDVGPVYAGSLIVLQSWTLIVTLRLIAGRWRRSRRDFVARREVAFHTAFTSWLRGELDLAQRELTGVLRVDPWDLRSRLLLAKVFRAGGMPGPARRQLVAARRLDRDDRFRDLIERELADRPPAPVDAPALEDDEKATGVRREAQQTPVAESRS